MCKGVKIVIIGCSGKISSAATGFGIGLCLDLEAGLDADANTFLF
jgi:hypothetical protein